MIGRNKPLELRVTVLSIALLIAGSVSCKKVGSKSEIDGVNAVHQRLVTSLNEKDTNSVAACLLNINTNNMGYVMQRFAWITESQFQNLEKHHKFSDHKCILYLGDKAHDGYALIFSNINSQWFVTSMPAGVSSE